MGDNHQHITDVISEHGQFIIAVAQFKDRNHPAYDPFFLPHLYTIGNHGRGLPELLYIGDTAQLYWQILHQLSRMQHERMMPLAHGESVDYAARFPARIVDAGARGREKYAYGVRRYYGTEQFGLRQVLLADGNGKYPGEAGCAYAHIPVLSLMH